MVIWEELILKEEVKASGQEGNVGVGVGVKRSDGTLLRIDGFELVLAVKKFAMIR